MGGEGFSEEADMHPLRVGIKKMSRNPVPVRRAQDVWRHWAVLGRGEAPVRLSAAAPGLQAMKRDAE